MYTVKQLRKFKVVRCPQKKTVGEMKAARSEDGAKYSYMSYKEIQAGEKDLNGEIWYPGAYGHRAIKQGDIIELGGRMANKAAANPDFEEVKEVVKKKRGRPRKDAAVSNNPV